MDNRINVIHIMSSVIVEEWGEMLVYKQLIFKDQVMFNPNRDAVFIGVSSF